MARTEQAAELGRFPASLAMRLKDILETNTINFTTHRTRGQFKGYSHDTGLHPFIVVVTRKTLVMKYELLTTDTGTKCLMYHVFRKDDFTSLYKGVSKLINCAYLGPVSYNWSHTSQTLEKCGPIFGIFVIKMGGRVMQFQKTTNIE